MGKANKRKVTRKDKMNFSQEGYPMRKNNRNKKVDSGYDQAERDFHTSDKFAYKPTPLIPQTTSQDKYLKAIKNEDVVLVVSHGPAGTGKSYVATSQAVDDLMEGKFEKIIITRPIQEAANEGKIGFLPGELEDKCAPYFRPIKDIMEQRLGTGRVKYLIEKNIIEFVPLELMRGSSFDNTIIILDEAQNTTSKQLELVLTRVGEGTKIIVDGDARQSDVKDSGLNDCINRMGNSEYTQVIQFTIEDVVRSGFAKDVILRYRK